MNKKMNPDRTLLQFMLRVQHQLARHDARSEKGYVMMLTSIITILLFSMLGAYLTMTNLNRAASAAYTKSNSTFYAAESGLNARAELIRKKVGSYDLPSGTSAASMSQCWNPSADNDAVKADSLVRYKPKPSDATLKYDQSSGVNDFGCKNYAFASTSGTEADRVVVSSGAGNAKGGIGSDGSFSVSEQRIPDQYISTTYVVDNPDKLATYPRQAPIPIGDLFAGMRMLEYTHRVYATAGSQTSGGTSAPEKTVLQLDFQTRFVPLFQFAAFYDQDLELNPGAVMNINGRVHSNSNLYLAGGDNRYTLCIAGQVSAGQKIYNRRKHAGSSNEKARNGNVYLRPNPGNCAMTQLAPPAIAPADTADTADRLRNVVSYNTNSSLNTTNSGNFDSTNRPNMIARFGNTNVRDGVDGIKVPSPDFLSKTDASGALSTYYTKADLRIEARSNPATTNDIFFNVTSIAQGMGDGSTCAGFNVADDKVGKSTSRCMKFEAGQLHSLRQPVLVRTGQTTDDTKLCEAELTGVTAATSPAIIALTPAQKDTLVRALQTAIVSQRSLVNYSDINSTTKLLSHSDFADIKSLFGTYLTKAGISTVTATALNGQSLASIARIAGDCFKPAPIQTSTTFYNRRESRNIAMVQTNIESLTIWNRDGLYAKLEEASGDPKLVGSKYQVATDGHNNGQGNSANQQVFKFAPIPANLVACNTIDDRDLCKKSFRHLGLASADNNEGGLVFHMTVDANNNVGTTTAYPAGQSPYGFAIIGAKQLPGALTIATDQAAYIQGDYNYSVGTGNTGNSYNPGFGTVAGSATHLNTATPPLTVNWTVAEMSNLPASRGGYKFPASILADSVNVLSNQCIDANNALDCGVLAGINTGTATTINAAFLAGNDIVAVDPGNTYSGGLHNYPRFHEAWNGNNLTYRGSFVSLGAPLQVNGPWSSTNYNAPGRNWDYDVDFNDVTNLPPLTPNMVYLRQRVFSRGYQN